MTTDSSSSDRTTPENGIHIKAKEMVERLDEEFSRFLKKISHYDRLRSILANGL